MYQDNDKKSLTGPVEYRELYEFDDSLYVTIDYNYVIQQVNFKASAFLGMERHLLIHHSFFNYVSSFSKITLINSVQNLINKGYRQTCEVELIIKGGARKQVQLEITFDNNYKIQLYLIDVTVITQQRNVILALEKELDLLNQLLNNSEEAIAALDENLCFKIINKSFNRLFAKIFSMQVKLECNLEKSLIYSSEFKAKIINACQQALGGERSVVIIENTNYEAKVYYYYEAKIYALMYGVNNKRIIFRIRDLTEHKLQEMLQHQQQSKIASFAKISTMEEMMSALSHEINQPLTVINTYSKTSSYLLQSELDVHTKLKKIKRPLEQIALQAEHAGKIIHGMRNLFCNKNLQNETTNINSLIQDTISILNYEFLDVKIKINLALTSNLPIVMTQRIQIMQVILNLARNSMEAFQDSKTMHPMISIQSYNLHTYIMVKIQDNGPGIPLENQGKILNTFFTTKPHGTGIGLAICRSVIERHGGEFKFLPSNEGTTFCFTLPINDN